MSPRHPRLCCVSGRTHMRLPQELAIQNDRSDILKFIAEAGGVDMDEALCSAVRWHRARCCDVLLRLGADAGTKIVRGPSLVCRRSAGGCELTAAPVAGGTHHAVGACDGYPRQRPGVHARYHMVQPCVRRRSARRAAARAYCMRCALLTDPFPAECTDDVGLHVAATDGFEELVTRLLSGEHIDAVAVGNCTPLFLAAVFGRPRSPGKGSTPAERMLVSVQWMNRALANAGAAGSGRRPQISVRAAVNAARSRARRRRLHGEAAKARLIHGAPIMRALRGSRAHMFHTFPWRRLRS